MSRRPLRRRQLRLSIPGPAMSGLARAAVPLIGRPDLWLTGVRSIANLARPGWWRRPPFLPLPDRAWLHFRLVTAYGGDGSGPVDAADLITWLEWRRTWAG